jgi:hypothetical protein
MRVVYENSPACVCVVKLNLQHLIDFRETYEYYERYAIGCHANALHSDSLQSVIKWQTREIVRCERHLRFLMTHVVHLGNMCGFT